MIELALDIETAPQEGKEELFQEVAFDMNSVKTGNMKDQEKINAKIESARIKHEIDQEKARQEFQDKSALSWTTGRITCICLYGDDISRSFCWDDEKTIINGFWSYLKSFSEQSEGEFQLLTWNGYNFDMPYINMRSLINGMQPIPGLRGSRYPRPMDRHIDVSAICTDRGKMMSLNSAASALLGIEKTGDGKEAIELWKNQKLEELQSYCMNDCKLTYDLWSLLHRCF